MSQAMKLNEESEATARKEAGVRCFPIFVATLKPEVIADAVMADAAAHAHEADAPAHVNGSNGAIGSHVAALPRPLFIESERWVDARAFAQRKLGASEVHIRSYRDDDGEQRPLPRWQIRWAGSAAGLNNLRMQAREIRRREPPIALADAWWRDIREM